MDELSELQAPQRLEQVGFLPFIAQSLRTTRDGLIFDL